MGFVLCPALAYPALRGGAAGPIVCDRLGVVKLAPCAPFLPAMADKARGDLGYLAAFMLLVSVVTVIYIPLQFRFWPRV